MHSHYDLSDRELDREDGHDPEWYAMMTDPHYYDALEREPEDRDWSEYYETQGNPCPWCHESLEDGDHSKCAESMKLWLDS